MIIHCRVRGCRFAHSHVTFAHKCTTCGEYGHGQLECGRLERIHALDSQDPHKDMMPVSDYCTIPACTFPWTHTTSAHHCATCGSRAPECVCQHRKCPQCNAIGAVNLDKPIFTGGECIICYESGPVVLFERCNHAIVCAGCAVQL
jgi:hypothetical protein